MSVGVGPKGLRPGRTARPPVKLPRMAASAKKAQGLTLRAEPAALPKSAAYITAHVDRMKRAMNGLGTDERTLLDTLESHLPPVVAQLGKEFERVAGRSLRNALTSELSGEQLRRALRRLDMALVDPSDTTGLSGVREKSLILRNQGIVNESELVSEYRPTKNNRLKLLIDGHQAFPDIFKAIDQATDHIHITFYIFTNDELGNKLVDHLIAAKKRGVEVRIQLDGIGSQLMNPWSGARAILTRLEEAGIETRRNHPTDFTRDSQKLNHPDHRKLVIIDGKVGYTGGMNVADHYWSKYHDVMVKASGPVVQQMQSEWVATWLHLGGKIPGDDATFLRRYYPKPTAAKRGATVSVVQHIPGENRAILRTYLSAINGAKKMIRIENAYCTNPDIQNALIAAANRGVEVSVILPGESDHAFSHLAAAQKYPEMIRSGVKIYEYPAFNHDKVMLVDDHFITMGSSNLDDVALYHVYELNLNIDDAAFAKEVNDRLFKKDIAKSKLMKATDVSMLKVATGKFWNLFSHYI